MTKFKIGDKVRVKDGELPQLADKYREGTIEDIRPPFYFTEHVALHEEEMEKVVKDIIEKRNG